MKYLAILVISTEIGFVELPKETKQDCLNTVQTYVETSSNGSLFETYNLSRCIEIETGEVTRFKEIKKER